MNQDQYDRIKKAIESQVAKGVTLKQHLWGAYYSSMSGWRACADTPCACALGCLLLEEQPPVIDSGCMADQVRAAVLVLGATLKEVNAFIDGFDILDYLPTEHDLNWYEAGRRMARECFG